MPYVWLCFGSPDIHPLSTCSDNRYTYQDCIDHTTYMKSIMRASRESSLICAKREGQRSCAHALVLEAILGQWRVAACIQIDCISGCVRISLADSSMTWRSGRWMNGVCASTCCSALPSLLRPSPSDNQWGHMGLREEATLAEYCWRWRRIKLSEM